MPGGDYSAKIGSQTVPVKLAADHYYTLVNSGSGQPQLIEEPPFKNKQKSLVRVQNLSDKALTLKAAQPRLGRHHRFRCSQADNVQETPRSAPVAGCSWLFENLMPPKEPLEKRVTHLAQAGGDDALFTDSETPVALVDEE